MERETSLDEFLQIAGSLPSAAPAGIIFHVSRCGSTLLTNALRAGGDCTTLSEAPVFTCAVQQENFVDLLDSTKSVEDIRREILQATVNCYTACYGLPVVIKAHTTDLLFLSRVRAVWPNVPFIINIRHPIEVIASNLAKPSDWVTTMLTPYGERNPFGFEGPATRDMTLEQYCARGLSSLLEAADAQLDSKCLVIDYAGITPETVSKAAAFFNIPFSGVGQERVLNTFSVYSKDKARKRIHEPDSSRKQQDASAAVHILVEDWALKPYERLSLHRLF
jgi:hypothetical protein